MKYSEGDDSTVTHQNNQYRVDDLLKIAESKPTIELPVKDLEWILKYTTVENSRIEAADTSVRIIVLKDKKRFIVLDGAHRLARAVGQGLKSLPSAILSPAELPKPIVSKPSSKQW